MPPFYANPAFWLFFASWLPYTLLVVFYGFTAPWWQTRIGRSLFLAKAAIVTVLSHVLVILIFGPYPWQEAVRAVLMGLVALAGWYQLASFVRTSRAARRSPIRPTDHKEKP